MSSMKSSCSKSNMRFMSWRQRHLDYRPVAQGFFPAGSGVFAICFQVHYLMFPTWHHPLSPATAPSPATTFAWAFFFTPGSTVPKMGTHHLLWNKRKPLVTPSSAPGIPGSHLRCISKDKLKLNGCDTWRIYRLIDLTQSVVYK